MPLISIVVLSYNSEATINYTLESISSQTVKDFEVIVCDDGSTDKSVAICEAWARENPEIKTRVIVSPVNQGITRNVNIGYKNSIGLWIKPIAGDDTLAPACIERFIALKRPDYDVYFVKCTTFGCTNKKNEILGWPNSFETATSKNLHRALLKKNYLPAPGSIIKKSALELVGFADERYKMLDDWPLWLRLSKFDLKFGFINEALVNYRISESSASAGTEMFVSAKLKDDIKNLYLNERLRASTPILSIFTILELIFWELNLKVFKGSNKSWRFFRRLLRAFSVGTYSAI